MSYEVETGNTFKILSIDGGGIKGIFSVAVLAKLEEDLKVVIKDYFDLIVGTSTGGIIALGLGKGMSPKEILEFYVEHGPAIFDGKTLPIIKNTRHYFRAKYENKSLKKALVSVFKDQLLGESCKRLVIPAYNIAEDEVYIFKTSHHSRLKRDYKVPMWKIAMATSAAPTYFPVFYGEENVRLVDGGVWANNPIMVGIVEAISMFNTPINDIRVFSLGTTNEVKGRAKSLDRGGLFAWRSEAVEVILRGQSVGANTQALHLLGKEHILRIDPKVADGLFEIDKITETALLGKASHESRKISPDVSNMFLQNKANEFIPCNK